MQYQIRKADRRHYPEIARLIVECKIGADTVEEQLSNFWVAGTLPESQYFGHGDEGLICYKCGESLAGFSTRDPVRFTCSAVRHDVVRRIQTTTLRFTMFIEVTVVVDSKESLDHARFIC